MSSENEKEQKDEDSHEEEESEKEEGSENEEGTEKEEESEKDETEEEQLDPSQQEGAMPAKDVAQKAEKFISADVRLISGCMDSQTSADVADVESFQLPDPAGSSGGACTSAMLQVLYADHTDTSEELTFQEVMLKIRDNLDDNFTQVSTVSRLVEKEEPCIRIYFMS
jgi:cobalamin biosynthesis protein CobT